ncbi:hypothetical protein HID58_084197, partial [Brassica napus]
FGISIVHRIDQARLSRSGLLRAILAAANRKGLADMEARLVQDEEASSSSEEDSEEQEDGFGSDPLKTMLSHVPSFDRSYVSDQDLDQYSVVTRLRLNLIQHYLWDKKQSETEQNRDYIHRL